MKAAKVECPDHEIAQIFPLLSDDELKELAADIKTNGLQNPIWLQDGKILDGRNRYRACLLVGVKPIFKSFEGDNPLAFVLSQNLHRRHLTESQRAMIAAGIATRLPGRQSKCANLHIQPTQEEAAEILSVSKRSVATAKQVLKHATKDVVDKVKNGELAVSAAAATLPSKDEEETTAAQAKEPSGKYAAALDRIGKVIGRKVRENIENGVLSNVTEREAVFWAGLKDNEMADIQELVVTQRWKAQHAWRFVNRMVTPETRLADLINRAIANGGVWEGKVGSFAITVTAPWRQ